MTKNRLKEKILKKVRGLLAIARDEANDEECQSALLLAQKLMLQYQIDKAELAEALPEEVVLDNTVTIYKKLFWWEKELASVIAINFRVKWFYSSKKIKKKDKVRKTCIVFYGLEEDLELAKEIYLLASDAMTYFCKSYIDNNKNYFKENSTSKIKNSYLRGFLNGLSQKFKKQKEDLKEQNYELVVLTEVPQVVVEAWEERTKTWEVASFDLPPLENFIAYQEGFDKATQTDILRKRLVEI